MWLFEHGPKNGISKNHQLGPRRQMHKYLKRVGEAGIDFVPLACEASTLPFELHHLYCLIFNEDVFNSRHNVSG